jgi:hypothetical protein
LCKNFYIEKKNRWKETVQWAADNGCLELVTDIPDTDFYFVEEINGRI